MNFYTYLDIIHNKISLAIYLFHSCIHYFFSNSSLSIPINFICIQFHDSPYGSNSKFPNTVTFSLLQATFSDFFFQNLENFVFLL